jgi:protein-S-isoprenylcysteine O-methyltransferase Ste14
MTHLLSRFAALPAYGVASLLVLLLHAVQSEIRFGKRARTHRAGTTDRMSTWIVAVSAAIPALGFVLAMKASSPAFAAFLPHWFGRAVLPGLPAVAWIGVLLGTCELGLRLWAVPTLRERYTRTLLIQDDHPIERGGPYRFVRHPGYLGSLLCLNGIGLTSGNEAVLLVSALATLTAYTYRVRVEDEMLLVAPGSPYAEYLRQVHALLPWSPRRHHAHGPDQGPHRPLYAPRSGKGKEE